MVKFPVTVLSRKQLRRLLLFAVSTAPFLALPEASQAECFERMSRVPMAAAGPAPGAVPYRAHMLRTGAAPKPRVIRHRVHRAAKRPVAQLAKAPVIRHRPRPAIARGPRVLPTPYVVAARAAATPAAFAMISATICEHGPPPQLMAFRSGPVGGTSAAPVGGDVVPTGLFPPDVGGVFPPGGGVSPPGGVFPPVVGPVGPVTPVTPPTGPDTPPDTPPGPPVTPPGPPGTDTPPVVPPVTPPDTGGPPVVPPVIPPVGPPDVPPPPVVPPVIPPVIPPVVPPVGAVPEPGAWALMLIGFGAVGGALRRERLERRRAR